MEDFIDEKHLCDHANKRVRFDPVIDITVKGFNTYGQAITRIIKVDGHWLADNDEYSTEIRFCPFCGKKL